MQQQCKFSTNVWALGKPGSDICVAVDALAEALGFLYLLNLDTEGSYLGKRGVHLRRVLTCHSFLCTSDDLLAF